MDSISVNLENLSEQERDSLMKLIEKANKSQSKVWKPEMNEKYWAVIIDGSIVFHLWKNDYFDNGVYNIGNCFRTEEEAKEEVTRLKMLKRWKDLSIDSGEEDNPWDGNTTHWYVFVSSYDKQICLGLVSGVCDANIFFPTKEACEAAVNELGEDNVKKYILGIKEDCK